MRLAAATLIVIDIALILAQGYVLYLLAGVDMPAPVKWVLLGSIALIFTALIIALTIYVVLRWIARPDLSFLLAFY